MFSTLINFLQSNTDRDIPGGERYIKTNDDDKDWLKNLKIKTQNEILGNGSNQPFNFKILPNLSTAVFDFNEKEYFVIIGWTEDNIITFEDILTRIQINAGLVTALLSDLKVPIRAKVKPLEIIEKVFYPIEDDYTGHNFEDVSIFFEPILVYQILDDSPLKGTDIERLSGFYMIKNCQNLTLKFSQKTLIVYEKLFLESPQNVPYENLVLSLTSVYWKYSFLDIYRCIEGIFPESRLYELHKQLNISTPLREFLNRIETSLKCKPKEEETVIEIIKNSPEDANENFRNVKKVIHDEDTGELGKFFYKIRNSIVHYRHRDEELKLEKLEDETWDQLIRGALLVVQFWYQKLDSL